MASINSYPNNRDEYIGAEEVMRFHHGRTSGVFYEETNCAVAAVQNAMAVTISDGAGWMSNSNGDGIAWWNNLEDVTGSKLQLTIDAAHSTLNRIDRVIVEWRTTTYADLPEIKILKGTAASAAAAPALTNNSTVRQISLARIRVNAGTTAITSSMITDERTDSAVCGIVSEIADGAVGTSKLGPKVVTRAKIGDGAVGPNQLDSEAVTREKLANNALYSPIVDATTGRAITAADLGVCIRAYSQNTNFTFTISLAEFQSWPTGFEFELVWYSGASVKLKGSTGIYLVSDKVGFTNAGTATLKSRFSTVAFKKIASDTLKVDGNAEVTAT